MAKKKHKIKHKLRNAAPRAPRADKDESPGKRLLSTLAGAGATSLTGAFLSRQGWRPKTAAAVLGVLGAGLAWKGDTKTIKSVGAGALSAATGELGLLLIDDRIEKAAKAKAEDKAKADKAKADADKDKDKAGDGATKKPANADGLPPGVLEAAFERARQRLGLDADDGSPNYSA